MYVEMLVIPNYHCYLSSIEVYLAGDRNSERIHTGYYLIDGHTIIVHIYEVPCVISIHVQYATVRSEQWF